MDGRFLIVGIWHLLFDFCDVVVYLKCFIVKYWKGRAHLWTLAHPGVFPDGSKGGDWCHLAQKGIQTSCQGQGCALSPFWVSVQWMVRLGSQSPMELPVLACPKDRLGAVFILSLWGCPQRVSGRAVQGCLHMKILLLSY